MLKFRFLERKNIEEQFLEAYDRYSRNILRHIHIRVSQYSSAEDILSETFLRTWQFVVEGGEIKSFKSFLYKTANNLIIDYYRKKAKTPLSLEESFIEPVAGEPSPESALDEKLLAQTVRSYLESLPPSYREIVIYRYIDDLTIKEIKEITGKTAANIYVILHRGLKQLKNNLKEKKYDQDK